MTRDELVTLTEELLDAVGSQKFGTTLKLQVLGHVYDRGWRRILRAHPTYRWTQRTVTQDADGRALISALSTADERFYRILGALSAEDESYRLLTVDPESYVAHERAERTLSRLGDQLQFTPVDAGRVVTVTVSHLPKALADQASGALVWPTDYELILAMEAAGALAAKGGTEIGPALHFKDQAEELWTELLAGIARPTGGPVTLGFSDTAAEWGG